MDKSKSQLTANLAWAKTALRYVEGKMTVGAGNRPLDLLKSFGNSFICVLATRSVVSDMNPDDDNAHIRNMAAVAEGTGCGNCGEHAASAYQFLKRHKISPIDYMIYRAPGDHAFVVIGRDLSGDVADYKTWGPSAVVCDAWDHKVLPASQIPKQMYKGWKNGFKSIVRA